MIPDCRIIQGAALTELRKMEAESVHMVCTSPPYWGLRDYGTATWEGGDPDCEHQQWRNGSGGADGVVDDRGQRNRDGSGAYLKPCKKCGARRIDQGIGLEQSPDEWAARLVEVFREVRRVLHPCGTVWCNVGDAMASGKGTCFNPGGGPLSNITDTSSKRQTRPLNRGNKSDLTRNGLKPKDLIGLPWLLAFALRTDGWYLRSAITLCKQNPMPESVTDRPTSATEMMFLFAKQARYYYDQEAVRQPATLNSIERGRNRGGDIFTDKWNSGNGNGAKADFTRGNEHYWPSSRNLWNWWPSVAEPLSESHFAAMPTAWVKPCVLAGTSERGVCPECGAPWVRETAEVGRTKTGGHKGRLYDAAIGAGIGGSSALNYKQPCIVHRETTGWRPGCSHGLEPVPATVLDCFSGSGTTGLIALQLGRSFVGIELSEEYCAMSERRLAGARAQGILALT